MLLLRARLPQTLPTASTVHFGAQRDTIPRRMRLDAAFKLSRWTEEDWGVTKIATATIGEFEYKFVADPFNRKWRFWTESIGNVEKLAFLKDWRAKQHQEISRRSFVTISCVTNDPRYVDYPGASNQYWMRRVFNHKQ